jgi:Na+-transporting methylmalonyl-CoA/oxaloacetate decarboxylase gamma subunit
LNNSLLMALVISAVGMTLLFLSLVVFYGLLTLLAALVKDRPSSVTEQTAKRVGTGDGKANDEQKDALIQAAAVAIALARAEAGEGSGFGALAIPAEAAADQPVSAWWSLHHQRQISVTQGGRRSR